MTYEEKIAEKREFRKQILAATSSFDWTIYNDRLVLHPKAAIKIGVKFDVTLKNMTQNKETLSDNHYNYYFQGTFQRAGEAISIDAYGLACSRKEKYSIKNQKEIPSPEIDEKKVAYDAYIDMWKNGIVTLFCLNSVSPSEFSEKFIDQVKVFEFGKKRY